MDSFWGCLDKEISSGFCEIMEISVIASSQVNLGRSYDAGLFSFGKNLSAKICSLKNSNLKASYLVQNQSLKFPSNSAVGFTLRASASPQDVNSGQNPVDSRTKPVSSLSLSLLIFLVMPDFFPSIFRFHFEW